MHLTKIHIHSTELMKHRSIALIDIENLYGDCSPQSPYGHSLNKTSLR